MNRLISAFARPSSALVALALTPVPAVAQPNAPRFTSVANPVLVTATSDTSVATERPGWIPPLSSAIIPGSGQLLMGQERGAVYLAVEVFLVTRFFTSQSDGRRAANRYRDMALEVARRPFNPVIRDTVFEYFEQMEKFIESGPFDTDPRTDVQRKHLEIGARDLFCQPGFAARPWVARVPTSAGVLPTPRDWRELPMVLEERGPGTGPLPPVDSTQ